MKRRVFKAAGLQRFLAWVAFWVVVLASALGIKGSSPQPIGQPSAIGDLSFSLTALKPQSLAAHVNGVVATGDSAPIGEWQGPIEPVRVQPSPLAPVILRIPTTEPVIFVGIDDGWIQTPQNLDWLVRHHLPFTLFLSDNGIKNDYDYFKQLQDAGMTVEDHTLSHGKLNMMTAAQQKNEICHTADIFQKVFGRRPTLLRPPYGLYNDDTRRVAAACGIKAIVMWHVVVGAGKGGDEQFQSNNHLQPGDIVLMHFKDNFLQDMQALVRDASRNHLQIGRLEDWIL